MASTIARAGLRLADLAAVYLAGGSSRIPLVERTVSDTLQAHAKVLGEPKNVVVAGAARWTVRDRVTVDDTSTRVVAPRPDEVQTRIVTPPVHHDDNRTRIVPPQLPRDTPPVSKPSRPWWRHPATIAAAVLMLLAGLGTVLFVATRPGPAADTRLAAPATLTTIANSDVVELSWAAVPRAARYVVYRDNAVISGSDATATTLTDKPGDTKSHEYVVAVDRATKFGRASRTVSAAAQSALSRGEGLLVSRLPDGFVKADTCSSDSTSTRTGVKCDPGTKAATATAPAVAPKTVYASQYTDHATLLSSRDQALATALGTEITGFSTTCTSPPSTGDWIVEGDPEGSSRGKRYCFVYESTATIEWSYLSDAILLAADASTDSIYGLDQWWRSRAWVLKPA